MNNNEKIKHTGFAITGLVLGLCSIILSSFLPIPILAIIFSAISRSKSKKNNTKYDSFATAGIILGIIFLVVGVTPLLAFLYDYVNYIKF